ncbi:hypothetical protein T484DRAFT_1766076 [Baffinella frigidus]|nr:hypothetical protein T484DRAFT_1766076 [Cryptophyta sp. CCMP2293]
MGCSLFAFTWFSIIKVVRTRLNQMKIGDTKKARKFLRIACVTYFTIWMGYPALWVLQELGVFEPERMGYPALWVLQEIGVLEPVPGAVFDVLAKSVYGFALLSFVLG